MSFQPMSHRQDAYATLRAIVDLINRDGGF
jgi:hypothetical protein